MLQLDVCLETVFPGTPAEERITRIAECGYNCVEFWMHDSTQDAPDGAQRKDPKALRQACAAAGVAINNFVVNPPDDGSTGGAPVMSETHKRYLERVAECIEFGKAAGCSKAITCAGNETPGVPGTMRQPSRRPRRSRCSGGKTPVHAASRTAQHPRGPQGVLPQLFRCRRRHRARHWQSRLAPALRCLPHADHGRKRHRPHSPEHGCHRAFSFRRRSRARRAL